MATVIDGWTLTRGEQWETTDGRLLFTRMRSGWMLLCQDVNDEMQLLDAGAPMDGEASFHQMLNLCHQVIGTVLTTRLHFVCYTVNGTPLALTRDASENGWSIELDFQKLAELPFLYAGHQWQQLHEHINGSYQTRREALCQLAATGIARNQLPQLILTDAITQMQ